MEERTDMFKLGDNVVHPNHGAGVIEKIVIRKVDGIDKRFFVFRMLVGSMTVLIPSESVDKIGLRPIISDCEADRLIEFIKNMEIIADDNWNKRYRQNMERLKSGDMEEVAYVVKSLSLRSKKKPLSTGERKIHNSAEMIFISEIAMAKLLSYEEAQTLLAETLDCCFQIEEDNKE